MKERKKVWQRTLELLVSALIILGSVFTTVDALASDGDDNQNEKSGAVLYTENCSRCHVERYATERSDSQWKTVMLHMRVRGQLVGRDADRILDYLKSSN